MPAKRRYRRPANRIVGLVSRTLADGTIGWYWMPSPSLRKANWRAQALGTDRAAAIVAAEAINQRVAIWRASPALEQAPEPRRKTVYSFGDLKHAFMQSDEWNALAPKTRREYRSRLNWLQAWADDGDLPLVAITPETCLALRDQLVAGDGPYNAAAKLRVLRLTLSWAAHKRRRLISENPAVALDVPTPPKRRKRISIDALAHLVAAGKASANPAMALAIELGFYTTQREADLLAAVTPFNWREIHDIALADRAILADADGRVMGLAIIQQKTKSPVQSPVPPPLSARVAAFLATRGDDYTGPLLFEDRNEIRPRHWPDWRFQRDFRATIEAAIETATEAENQWLVDQLTGLKFRDLRRSGMCWLREMGATIAQIASISGHSIKVTTDILDTYLPADPRTSAAGMAHALRGTDEAEKRTA